MAESLTELGLTGVGQPSTYILYASRVFALARSNALNLGCTGVYESTDDWRYSVFVS